MELRPERVCNSRFPADVSQVGFSFRKEAPDDCGSECGNSEAAVADEKVHMPLCNAAGRCELRYP